MQKVSELTMPQGNAVAHQDEGVYQSETVGEAHATNSVLGIKAMGDDLN